MLKSELNLTMESKTKWHNKVSISKNVITHKNFFFYDCQRENIL